MTTKKEQEWYKKFLEGTFLAKGWISRETELLENFEGSEREHMASLLHDLGEKIGREWAKDNDIRRIDTPMLRQWGNHLVSAKKQGPDMLAKEVKRIESEVDKVLKA
jgi:hypothetical protein